MMRELPRTGMKVTLNDFNQGLRSDLWGQDGTPSFEDRLSEWLGVKHVFCVSSGRAALYLILRGLRLKSDKDTVIIPAFICPSIPAVIGRAGLKVKVCDISRNGFDFDRERLGGMIDGRTLCVVCAHLAGFPCDVEDLLKIANSNNTELVEDCAQAMGAEYDGKRIGQFGSFGFFSLGRGKGLTTYAGGLIVTERKDYIGLLRTFLSDLSAGGVVSNMANMAKMLTYSLFFRPHLFFYAKGAMRLYWRVRNLPLHAENEYHTTDFNIGSLSAFQKGVGRSLLGRMDNVIEEQRRRAGYMADRLRAIGGIDFLRGHVSARPTYPLLPVIFEDAGRCEKVYSVLQCHGLGVSRLYTRPINRYEYLGGLVPKGIFPNAESISRRMLTLPTNSCVTTTDMDRIIDIIKRIV